MAFLSNKTPIILCYIRKNNISLRKVFKPLLHHKFVNSRKDEKKQTIKMKQPV